jgi:hypothetical protein
MRKYLGPSQFAAAIGCDEYLSNDKLINILEKGDNVENDDNGENKDENVIETNVKFGHNNEDIIKYVYSKKKDIQILTPRFVVDKKNNRIGGICDGIFMDPQNTKNKIGLEIKSHINGKILEELPLSYIVQVIGYMYLYEIDNWILLSCIFDNNNNAKEIREFNICWDKYKDMWYDEIYPKLTDFTSKIRWQK